MTTPNPLQELAEKLGEVTFKVSSLHETYAQIKDYVNLDRFLPILTASLGTLLQAERAAMVKLGSEYIRGHWVDSEMVADAMLKELTVPADASALSAVVQRETEELKALLTEALATIREYIQSDATRWIKANENTTITSKIAKVLEEATKKEKNASHSKTDGERTSGIKA